MDSQSILSPFLNYLTGAQKKSGFGGEDNACEDDRELQQDYYYQWAKG